MAMRRVFRRFAAAFGIQLRITLCQCAVALVWIAAPEMALAHQNGISYGEYEVRGDRLDASLRLSATEVETMRGADDLVQATVGLLQVARGAAPCALVPAGAHPELPDGVRVSGAFQCAPAAASAPFRVDLTALLARLSWGHTHLAKIVAGDRVEEHVVGEARPSFAIAAAAPSWRTQAARFVRLGLEHIFTGPDHVAFVLGLLLLGGTLRQVLGVVTSFTLAHSVTLAVASLGLCRLPSSIVEPLIAASIVAIAVENLRELRSPTPRGASRRWKIGFAFGLVHGFGFAGALTNLHLPTARLATALLSFNAGVELGQAFVVAAAFPLLDLLRQWPARVPDVLRAGSVGIGLAGAVWLVERLPWPPLA